MSTFDLIFTSAITYFTDPDFVGLLVNLGPVATARGSDFVTNRALSVWAGRRRRGCYKRVREYWVHSLVWVEAVINKGRQN